MDSLSSIYITSNVDSDKFNWQIGCLKEEFKIYSKVGLNYTFDGQNYTYPNCTTPWHQSMLGITEYNDEDVNVCSSDDAYTLYSIDYKFAETALKGESKHCKGTL